MKLNIIAVCARRFATELSDLWREHQSSAHHGNPTEALSTQTPSGKPINDQRAALNRWEGEGGRTAATRP
jgi:hypothetical protein